MSTPHSHPLPIRAPSLDQSRVNPIDPAAPVLGPDEISRASPTSFEPGRCYYARERHVEYLAGNLPLLITVPHGGYSSPAHIPDRVGGCHEPDICTQELARALVSAFSEVLGRPAWPHMVLARLRRGKVDFNRAEHDAAQSDEGRAAWRDWRAFVRVAKKRILLSAVNGDAASAPAGDSCGSSALQPPQPQPQPPRWPRGLVLDLHGQSHDARHQLGYYLSGADLELSDQQLDASEKMRDKCSVRCVIDPILSAASSHNGTHATASAASSHPTAAGDSSTLPRTHIGSLDLAHPCTLSSVLRGERSLGALLQTAGYASIPSPAHPTAAGIAFFHGGYNTVVNGSSATGAAQRQKEREADAAAAAAKASGPEAAASYPPSAFDAAFDAHLEGDCFAAIQLESAYGGARDSDDHIEAFARTLARALLQWINWHVLPPDQQLRILDPSAAGVACEHEAAQQ